jgi:hypothetical protein
MQLPTGMSLPTHGVSTGLGGVAMVLCYVDVKRKHFVSCNTDEHHSDRIRNGQSHLRENVGRLLLNLPVDSGSDYIGA